jgi:nuclear transport factor 2 (NTF2) superfamily protein
LICRLNLWFQPFTRDIAVNKVRLAEDGWNSRNPEKVHLAYTPDSHWRNRAEFLRLRLASINDLPIKESDRKFRWPLGRRPDDHPGLSELGL